MGAFTSSATAGTVGISFTPTASGTATFNVNVTDANGAMATQSYSITVLSITPNTLPPGTAGTNYMQTITVTGGTTPYTTFMTSNFNAGGTGLTNAEITPNATAGTFVINGTPTAGGTATFDVNVVDSAGVTVDKPYSITINQAPTITNGPPTSPTTVNVPYTFTYTTTGFPKPTFSVSSGALPTGLTLSSRRARSRVRRRWPVCSPPRSRPPTATPRTQCRPSPSTSSCRRRTSWSALRPQRRREISSRSR